MVPIPHVEQVKPSCQILPDVQLESAELDISTVPIIYRKENRLHYNSDHLKLTNPLVLKEAVFLNKGDRVVIKKSKLVGTTSKYVGTDGFDVTLDDDSIVSVESIDDVWLLIEYNDKHDLVLHR